jgi:O-antigen/teichoic acid export membrane protein
VAQVYFVKAARSRSEGGLDALTQRVFYRLFELGLFPMIIVLIAGPDVIKFVLGPDWETAGTYAQWLAVWLLFLFVSSPLTRLFDVLERLKANLVFNVLLFGSRIVVLVVAGNLGDPLLAIGLYGGVSAVLYGGLLAWLLVLAGVRIGHSVRFMARCLAISVLPALAVYATSTRYAPPTVFVVAVVAAIAYGFIVVTLQRRKSASGS